MAELTHVERAILNGNLEGIAVEVQLERRRQVTEEGYSPARDDRYANNELAKAATAYLAAALFGKAFALGFWPWDRAAFRPKGVRRNLVVAAALLLAAIERLDRGALIEGEVEGA